jgi:hypothetical protein
VSREAVNPVQRARCAALPTRTHGQRARQHAAFPGGEHPFAPAVMTDRGEPRSQRSGGADRPTCTDLRWSHLAARTRAHYSEPRQRLNGYASISPQASAAIPVGPSHRQQTQNPREQTKQITYASTRLPHISCCFSVTDLRLWADACTVAGGARRGCCFPGCLG